MSADVARGHGGDGGSDDRPPPYQAPTGCGGCLGNRGKGTRKPNLGGRRAGRLHTRQETRNLGLKAITDKNGPVSIRFEFGDKETLMPLSDHASNWANYLWELVRELPLHYPSWRQMPPEWKAGVVAKIGMESSATREYPSLIHTFFLTHTVGGVFLNPEDKALYDEILRLQGLGSNTSTGVPYTEDEIIAIVREGKQRGHIPGVGNATLAGVKAQEEVGIYKEVTQRESTNVSITDCHVGNLCEFICDPRVENCHPIIERIQRPR
ncbi:hypothetical protein Tco_1331345 [Tanacetum coccineum]